MKTSLYDSQLAVSPAKAGLKPCHNYWNRTQKRISGVLAETMLEVQTQDRGDWNCDDKIKERRAK